MSSACELSSLCQRYFSAFSFTVIDLSNHDETVTLLHLGNVAGAVSANRAKFSFTRDLDMILAYIRADDRRTMFVCWNLRPLTRDSSLSQASNEKKQQDEIHAECVNVLDVRVVNAMFINTKDVVIGTFTGEMYILDTFSLNVTEVFTKDSVLSTKTFADTYRRSKSHGQPKPHRSPVKHMHVTPDQGHLLSIDAFRICVWNLKNLFMAFATPASEKV